MLSKSTRRTSGKLLERKLANLQRFDCSSDVLKRRVSLTLPQACEQYAKENFAGRI
jgi:hypothetical protein